MRTTLGTTDVATDEISVAKVDMRLEVVTIPVSDVDRATAFYGRLGWRQDVTPPGSGVVQFTPPASGCSIQFGRNRTSATPGSAEGVYLIVSDVVAARENLVAADIEVSGVFHLGADGPASGRAPERHSYGSFVSFSDPDGNRCLLQEVTTRLPGRVDPAATSFGSANDLEAALIRAATAHGEHEKRNGGRIRREMADLVRRIHGGGAGRDEAADVSADNQTRKELS